MRPLFHRWFVQYNPLYLLSAALVLVGGLLCSRGLGTSTSTAIEIELVTELYAVALIGGAAFLERMGLRRPAVMLGLLVTLYQWDLMLHTETCGYLVGTGTVASIGWFGLFFAKMAGIAWALRLRFSRRIWAMTALAASGLAWGPQLLRMLDYRQDGMLITAWLFALCALYDSNGISTKFELDAWGKTVLRRSTLAVTALSGLLLSMHVLLWASDRHFHLEYILVVFPLLLVRRVERESIAWTIVLSVLVGVALLKPGALSVTALLAAASFAHRVLSPPRRTTFTRTMGVPTYRALPDLGPEQRVASVEEIVAPGERARLAFGILGGVYLAMWSFDWMGGSFPHHIVVLDLAYATISTLLLFRTRQWTMAPLGIAPFAMPIAQRVPTPHNEWQVGVMALICGFVLLGVGLGATWWLRRRVPEDV